LGRLLVALGLVFSAAVFAEPETPTDYVKIFTKGSDFEKESAAESLAWAGISSPQLFDLIEQDLLLALPTATDKTRINYAGWLTKALAFSGNEKYRPTLEKVLNEAPNRKLKGYGKWALQSLPDYTKFNTVIAPKAWPSFAHPNLHQRLKNMLQSDNSDLLRLAAKRMYNTHNDAADLLAIANTKVQSNYQLPLDNDRADAIAWLCKVLAASRAPEYKSTLEQVMNSANNKRLRKYAKKYMSYY
jgi:hypothetical protein